VGGDAAAALSDLDSFANAGSLKDIFEKLGGEDTLAAQMFVSVTDEPDLRLLESFAKRRQKELILKQVHVLVQHVQELAKQLSADDSLIGQVLALSVDAVEGEDDDEAGTGEQESGTEEKKKKNQKPKRVEKKSAAKPPVAVEKKRSRGAANPPMTVVEKEKKKKEQPKKKKTKEVAAVAPAAAAGSIVAPAAAAAAEEAALVEEEVSAAMCKENVIRLLVEAEQEFAKVQEIAQGRGGVPLNVPPETPPNVEQLIRVATLDNVACLHEQPIGLNTVEAHASLQAWFRTCKRACQVHGVFELLRADKMNFRTLCERYNHVIQGQQAGVWLSFTQAAKYDRLGKFLSQFPLFVFQRKWTTLVDWYQKATDNNDVLMDALPSIAPVSSFFFRDAFSLHVHGFQVIPALMTDKIDDSLISNCKTRCEQDGEVIFNNVKSKPDSRSQ
jgi:hypothetical protein